MGDVGDMFNALKAARQEKRASNRKSSPEVLKDAGISFESKNGGAHLIVPLSETWPSIFGQHQSHQWRGLTLAAMSEGGA